MRYFITFVRVILILLNTGYQMSILAISSLIKGKSDALAFRYRRKWAHNCQSILGIQMDELQGQVPTEGNYLIISNHRTLLDPIVQAAFIDAFIIAKSEVSKLPIIGKGAEMTGIIFVKRASLRSRNIAREQTELSLKMNRNVLVYAEGTTSTSKLSGAFKPGTFKVASELKIPVIPLAIEYPKHKDYWFVSGMFHQLLGQIGAYKTRVKLRIGPPLIHDDPKILMVQTKTWIDQNLSEMQVGWSEIFPS